MLERGGWPELWADETLPPIQFLNDYIRTTLEKDIISTSGIEKTDSFMKVTRLIAGRLGGLFVASEIARDAGVHSSTVRNFITGS